MRARAHLLRREVTIAVPTPMLRFDAGRWQVHADPFYWRWERTNFPSDWHKLPEVDGVVAPIMKSWSFGPVHVRRFRWRHG